MQSVVYRVAVGLKLVAAAAAARRCDVVSRLIFRPRVQETLGVLLMTGSLGRSWTTVRNGI